MVVRGVAEAKARADAQARAEAEAAAKSSKAEPVSHPLREGGEGVLCQTRPQCRPTWRGRGSR